MVRSLATLKRKDALKFLRGIVKLKIDPNDLLIIKVGDPRRRIVLSRAQLEQIREEIRGVTSNNPVNFLVVPKGIIDVELIHLKQRRTHD